MKSKAKILSLFMAAGIVASTFSAPVLSVPVMAAAEQTASSDSSDDAAYLKEYFDIDLADGFTAEQYADAVSRVAADGTPQYTGGLSWQKVIENAVAAADFEELAQTYPDSKIEARLNAYGVQVPEDDQFAQDLVTALDTELITPKTASIAMTGTTVSAADAESLLMNIADANGKGRNYLGMASDPDIYGKLDRAWNSFEIFDDDTLNEIGKDLVEQQVTTGYGIKSAEYDARFLSDLTLQYGHDDIKHANQLIGLLRSENINAKVALEPKISIYQYLLEWGPVPEPTPTYEVRKYSDDLYLVYAVEYDLKLEFDNEADMLRFDEIVKAYAKKSDENPNGENKIYSAWWQPLYSSTRTDLNPEDYHLIYDCVVTNGNYSIHPFATAENTVSTIAAENTIAQSISGSFDISNLKIEAIPRMCNTAFYNYLTGADYQ